MSDVEERNPEELDEEEIPDQFLDILHHHFPRFSTMTGDLWLITLTLWGQLAAAALLLVIAYFASGESDTVSLEGENAQMPFFVFKAGWIFFGVAWTFLLSGALEVGFVGLTILLVFTYASTGFNFATLSRWRFELLGILWLIAVTVWCLKWWLARRGHSTGSWWMILSPAVAVWLLLFYYFAPEYQSRDLIVQLHRTLPFLIPIVFLSGRDFAEIGDAMARWVTRKMSTSTSPGMFAGICLVVFVGLGLLLLQPYLPWFAIQIGSIATAGWAGKAAVIFLGGGILGYWFLIAIGWVNEPFFPGPHVPIVAVLAGAVLLQGGFELAHLQNAAEQKFPVTTFPEAPVFSLAVPERATVSRSDKETERNIFFSGGGFAENSTFAVESEPPIKETEIETRVRAEVREICLQLKTRCVISEIHRENGTDTREKWKVFEIQQRQTSRACRLWAKLEENRRLWLLSGCAPKANFEDEALPIFLTMVESWRPDDTAKPTVLLKGAAPRSQEAREMYYQTLPFFLGLVIGIPLVRRGRRHPGLVAAAGLYAVVVAIFQMFHALLAATGELQPAAPLGGAQLLAGAVGLYALVHFVMMWDGSPSIPLFDWKFLNQLLALNIGLFFLRLMYLLYALAIISVKVSVVIQAVVLLIALLWEFMTSGKDITNGNTRRFSRRSRMLLYTGYLMLVCTAVFFNSSLRRADRVVEPLFEAEALVRDGIIWLGVPILLSRLALRYCASLKSFVAGE